MTTPSSKGKGRGHAFLQSLVGWNKQACVLWPFSVEQNGYGQFGHNGQYYRAHKFICELTHGPAPVGYEAAHSCGVARCVNPNHLSWKSRSENELDKRAHGTQGGGASSDRGNGGCRTHLTPAQIADIRANKGKVAAHVLAEKHGIKRGGVRYWWGTTHEPLPPGTSASSLRRRATNMYG